jgi:predicted ATPase/DNA-binding SARP family transcriptional activator
MSAALEIRLFGPLRAYLRGEPAPRFRTRSVGRLLALLALRQGQEVDRSWLAVLLWPDSSEATARQNLRNELLHLRRALGTEADRLLAPTRDRLALALEGAEVDVHLFDRWVKAGDEASLQKAASLYSAPLLEGCLEEWALPERQARAAAMLTVLERLSAAAEARGDHSAALGFLRRAEGLEPLRDTVQRGLLRLLAASGDRPAAVQQFREYRLRLHQELNAAPDEETTRLFQEIRARPAATAALEPAAAGAPPVVAPTSPQPAAGAALPHPLTQLIGRKDDLAQLSERLGEGRLVTLVGSGGVGKTRLAIEAARRAAGGFADGVAFLPLAEISDPSLLGPFAASALGLVDQSIPPGQLDRAIGARLAGAQLLLVLDNCEHLMEAAAALAQSLLEHCPRLQILATSRQRLGIVGELVWKAPSLPGPGAEEVAEAAGDLEAVVLRYPAARLLVERAQMVRPGFRVTCAEAALAIAQICRRLDGIPLALELAAGRCAHLPVQEVAARLDDRFRLLRGGSRGVLPRHRTLRTLLDWSYDLLDEPQRLLLRRLAVFGGGWALEAAEAVCADAGADDSLAADDVVDVLAALVDQSVVQYDERAGGGRYFLLETLREYALERLRAAGEETAYRRRHRDHFLALAAAAAPLLEGPEQHQWLERLEQEHGNLRAALEWRDETGEAEPGLRLVNALFRFWGYRGLFTEGRQYLRAALAQEPGPDQPAALNQFALALRAAGVLALDQKDHSEAWSVLERSLAIFDGLGNISGVLLALGGLGNVLMDQGRAVEAGEYYQRALVLAREAGDRRVESIVLSNLGFAAFTIGDFPAARKVYTEALVIARESGGRCSESVLLQNLGCLALREGDLDGAAARVREALHILRAFQSVNRYNLETLELGAAVIGAQGDYARAALLYGATKTFRRLAQLPLGPVYQQWRAESEAAARAALGEDAYADYLERGGTFSLDQAVSVALAAESLPLPDWAQPPGDR